MPVTALAVASPAPVMFVQLNIGVMPHKREYLRLAPGDALPDTPFENHFKVVVAIEANVTDKWRNAVSEWLVRSGCLYMMAWGSECSQWDDSVDWANLEWFDFGDIPDESFVMTTWHNDQPLADVLWFAKHTAWHDTVELEGTLILHISARDKDAEFLEVFDAA